jgi:hypothetical protein
MDYQKKQKLEFEYVLRLTADEIEVIKILAASTDITGWEESEDKDLILKLRSLAI